MTKQELKNTILEDLKRFDGQKPGLKDFILKNESFFIWQYIEHLRHVEYYTSKSGLSKLAYFWHWYWLKQLQFRLHYAIYPNTIGSGFRIYHIGNYTHVGPKVRIGKNCTMVSGVVFGNRNEENENCQVIVGDNCYFGLDCKILGSVHIGNNVTIGANAVVTKDIPDNAVVVGVPAKIIRYTTE
ncbi:MAG: serine acetyltransferase [Bacteroidaceae bacterium]|nr:serine acetyltransferase [Bacteroidaceae bacterium]